MNLRAILFDLYGTLLEISPPPADAPDQWQQLWRATFGPLPRLTLQEFTTQCDQAIAREHAAGHVAGVRHPEVLWPDIAGKVLPELMTLAPDVQSEFLFQHSRLRHTLRLMPGAAEALHHLSRSGFLLGLASNCQSYSLRSFDEALAAAGLGRELFAADLCFFSFQHGFSKPDPHVFRLLAARLGIRGIAPGDAMVVGDRLDSDITPAWAQGFQTWHLARQTTQPPGGLWADFLKHLPTLNPVTR